MPIPLLLHLCDPINISYIETIDQFEWDVVAFKARGLPHQH